MRKFADLPGVERKMIRRIGFAREKYGRPLLVDIADVREMPDFIQTREPHALAFTEIMIVHEGSGTLSLDGQDLRVDPGALFVTRRGQVRSWRLESRLEATTAFYEDGFLGPGDLVSGAVAIASEHFVSLRATLRAMADVVRTGNSGALRSGLARALSTLPKRTPAAGVLARRLQRLIERQGPARRRVADCAAILGVSPEHLCREVRASTGRTPGDLLHEALVLEIKRRLLYSSEPASGIAEDLRFCDASYLTRFFRESAGMTPGEFRRRGAS